MRACVSRPSPAPSFAVHPLVGQPRTPVDVWRAPRSSVAGLDPGVVGDRPEPHLLAALLTPTRAPHARLPKHWKGELSLRRWSDTRFLVGSLALCFFLSPFAFPLLTFSLQNAFFPLLSLLTFSLPYLSLQNIPLSLFPHFFIIFMAVWSE